VVVIIFFPSTINSTHIFCLMGCAQAKEPKSKKDDDKKDDGKKSSSQRVKEYTNSKSKERSIRTVYSVEPTYHIKTEDYKPVSPPPTSPQLAPDPQSHGSLSRDNTTLSSNKDDNMEEGVDSKDKAASGTGEEVVGHMERKGSIVRDGVYYSESELSEEPVWQPKYWTPDRIGKWIEDIEFPDTLRFQDVCKVIAQSNMTVPIPHHPLYKPNNPQPSSSSPAVVPS